MGLFRLVCACFSITVCVLWPCEKEMWCQRVVSVVFYDFVLALSPHRDPTLRIFLPYLKPGSGSAVHCMRYSFSRADSFFLLFESIICKHSVDIFHGQNLWAESSISLLNDFPVSIGFPQPSTSGAVQDENTCTPS